MVRADDVTFATINPVGVTLGDIDAAVFKERSQVHHYRLDRKGGGVVCFDHHDTGMFRGPGCSFCPWGVNVICFDSAL